MFPPNRLRPWSYIAAGAAVALPGRYIPATDDVAQMIAGAEEISEHDLYVLRGRAETSASCTGLAAKRPTPGSPQVAIGICSERDRVG
jgi:hypothetical protein